MKSIKYFLSHEKGLARIFLLAMAITASSAQAGIYSWVDATGVRHFSDSPVFDPGSGKNGPSVKEVKETVSAPGDAEAPEARPLPSGEKIYRFRQSYRHYYRQPKADSVFAAAASGDLARAREIVSSDPSAISAADAVGDTALHHAAGGKVRAQICQKVNQLIGGSDSILRIQLKETLPVIDFLVENGSDINRVSHCGNTPLHIAVFSNQLGIAKKLLELGADPNIVNKPCANAMMPSGTPLHVALGNNALPFDFNEDFATLLLDKGAKCDTRDVDGATPLHLAAFKGSKKLIRRMLKSGAEANALTRHNWNALHFAAHVYNNRPEICDILIEAGADPRIANSQGSAPMHVAAKHGNLGIVEALIRKGGDTSALDAQGKTPFEIAADNGDRMEMAALLEKNGKPVPKIPSTIEELNRLLRKMRKEYYRKTIPSEKIQVIKSILDENPDLVRQWDKGFHRSPLHCAGHNATLVRLLLERGADPNIRNNSDEIPLHRLFSRECVALYLEHGSDVNATNQYGCTPLHYLAESTHDGTMDCIRMLLEHGADPNIPNDKGKTPYELAKSNSERAKLFQSFGAR